MFTFREMFASLAPFFNFREMFASLAPFFNFREMFTSLAPFFTAAVVIVLTPFVKEHIPLAVSDYLVSMYEKWLSRFSNRVTVIIEERGNHHVSNQVYEAVRVHLLNLISTSTKPKRFKLKKEGRQNESIIDMVENEEVIEKDNGISLSWKLRAVRRKDFQGDFTERYFELSFDKGLENEVLKTLHGIVVSYEKMVKIYSRDNGSYDGTIASSSFDRDRGWIYAIFKHPFTFEKLAMDPEKKKTLKADLDWFRESQKLYANVGKTWKRGYLLYGPPGTGKSSLIAAMANYLGFDIYDLNLSSRLTDVGLRNILLSTTNRSILVIEDIDFGAELAYQKGQYDSFTLSGLLNIIDGLWSSCGEERIIVFTTNNKDKLDPALLRPGRMDVQVHMSYCTIDGFKLLATNYLKIKCDHQLYRRIEDLLEDLEVTPAEIAEELLKSGGTDVVLRGVVEFLEQREREKAKAAEFLEQREREKAKAAELMKRLKERLKSADIDIDVDAEGLVEFYKQKKLEKAKATEAERLLNSGDTDVDVEGLVEFIKQKKIEDPKAAEAKRINPNES